MTGGSKIMDELKQVCEILGIPHIKKKKEREAMVERLRGVIANRRLMEMNGTLSEGIKVDKNIFKWSKD